MSPEILATLATFANGMASIDRIVDRMRNAIYNEVPREDFDTVLNELRLARSIIFKMESEMRRQSERIKNLEKRTRIEEDYMLTKVGSECLLRSKDGVAFLDSSEQSSVQPVHYICQVCAETRGHRIILRPHFNGGFYCPVCRKS